MNAIKNKVQLIGHLGADPELRSLDNGNQLARFSLATNEAYKNQKGEKEEKTQWHSVVAWGKLAGIADQLLSKGTEVVVDGRLTHRNYEDKEGIKRYSTDIVANELYVLGGKK